MRPVIKLIASVSGGVLEAIHTDANDVEFDVQVFDWDNIEGEDIGEDEDPLDHVDAEHSRYIALIKPMKEIL